MIVPVKAVVHVACDPDVVARRVAVTSNEVDDSLFNAVHASAHKHAAKPARVRTILQIALLVRESAIRKVRWVARTSGGTGGPPSRLRRFGETASARGPLRASQASRR